MRKIILTALTFVALVSANGEDYDVISYVGYKNLVGVLQKQFQNTESASISITDKHVTISAYGDSKTYKVSSQNGNVINLDSGAKVIVKENTKEIRVDYKNKPEDEYYNYTYIFHLK